jgi:hypothetical protein
MKMSNFKIYYAKISVGSFNVVLIAMQTLTSIQYQIDKMKPFNQAASVRVLPLFFN